MKLAMTAVSPAFVGRGEKIDDRSFLKTYFPYVPKGTRLLARKAIYFSLLLSLFRVVSYRNRRDHLPPLRHFAHFSPFRLLIVPILRRRSGFLLQFHIKNAIMKI